MRKFNYIGILILSFLIVTQNGLYAQNADDKKLQVIEVPGYQYPTTVNPSVTTNPAQQLTGVLINDATDIRVFPSSNPQSEIHTSISKANPQNILISAQTYFGTSVQGYYYSNNGGTTWAGADQLPNNVVGRGDPSTAFDYDGNGYLVSMAATSAMSNPDGYFVQKTLNGGSNWQTQVRGVTNSNFDKEMVAIDNSGSSPYKNYFYCAWTDFTGSYSVKFNRSVNGCTSFTTPIILKSG